MSRNPYQVRGMEDYLAKKVPENPEVAKLWARMGPRAFAVVRRYRMELHEEFSERCYQYEYKPFPGAPLNIKNGEFVLIVPPDLPLDSKALADWWRPQIWYRVPSPANQQMILKTHPGAKF